MTQHELRDFLNEKVQQYNHPNFIETDPIQIPHLYTHKEDIEIAGFLAATIAWGNRKMIINSARKIIDRMGNSPFDFVMAHRESDLDKLNDFVHRTFNTIDLKTFVKGLQHIYGKHGGMEAVFQQNQSVDSMQPAISAFKKIFFEIEHQQRTQKHISDPGNNSAAKRMNMFIRVIKVFN